VVEHVNSQFVSYPSISKTPNPVRHKYQPLTINQSIVMRPDMHKVVVERPRWNPGPGKKGRQANLCDELLPKFEGIKRPHRHRKGLTDLLGPLKRWLHAQVGRRWNDVYSEACAVIKPDSVIRAHVKTHLLEFVQRHTFMHDGKVSYLAAGRGGGVRPVLSEKFVRRVFYVHPETGLLEKIEPVSRKRWVAQERQSTVTVRWLRKNVALQQIRGLWFECHFEVVPVGVSFKVYDHALERLVSRGELARYDTRYLHCKLKRQLSKRELGRFGLRNASNPHSVGAQSSAGRLCGRLNTALCFLAGRRLWVLVNPAVAVQFRPEEHSKVV
jgi:hypothetical protein